MLRRRCARVLISANNDRATTNTPNTNTIGMVVVVGVGVVVDETRYILHAPPARIVGVIYERMSVVLLALYIYIESEHIIAGHTKSTNYSGTACH